MLAPDGQLEALRTLVDHRDQLSRRRVQTVNRLHRLLAELVPGAAKKDLTAPQAKQALASVRPRDIAGKTRRRVAADELADLVTVEKKVKELTRQIQAIVTERGSHLTDLYGVGPVVAGRILADVGDVARFADRNRFASWTGTAPLDASSGEHTRHRLSRAGNRRVNHMLHIAAITQIRNDTAGQAYYRRKIAVREDPNGSHALPETADLRRRLPPARRRRQPRRTRTNTPDGERSWRGPGRALGGVSRIQRGRPAHPGHRLFGSATTRARSTDATGPTPTREHPTQLRLTTPPRRRAGAVKVERPTGRTTLTATSTGAHSKAPKLGS